MHHKWTLNKLGKELNDNGYSSIEIDEISLIGNPQVVY